MPVVFDHGKFALASPEFIWPETSAEAKYFNPIERAGGRLVRELARVGWDVPGIRVEVVTSGSGESLWRHVASISGRTEDGLFRLAFLESRERRCGLNVLSGLSHAVVPPGVEIEFFSDGSGPTACLYLGGDWKADGADFIDAARRNARLNREPKTYLRYQRRGAANVLDYDDDLGREYSPTGDQPRKLRTDEVADGVVKFIDGLIAKLSARPTAPGADDVTIGGDANMRRLAAVEPVSAPSDFPVLYAWVDNGEAHRMRQIDDFGPERRYGLSGNGWRLCGLGNQAEGVPARATDGFCYASADPAVRAGHVVYDNAGKEMFPVVVKLRWLNDVFVVDNAAFDRAREDVLARIENEGRSRMSDRELDGCIASVARTMVSAGDYAGGFERPMYLIGRQTAVDEAGLVAGEVVLSKSGGRTSVVVRNEEAGDFVLASHPDVSPHTPERTARAVKEALWIHARRDRAEPVETGEAMGMNP